MCVFHHTFCIISLEWCGVEFLLLILRALEIQNDYAIYLSRFLFLSTNTDKDACIFLHDKWRAVCYNKSVVFFLSSTVVFLLLSTHPLILRLKHLAFALCFCCWFQLFCERERANETYICIHRLTMVRKLFNLTMMDSTLWRYNQNRKYTNMCTTLWVLFKC